MSSPSHTSGAVWEASQSDQAADDGAENGQGLELVALAELGERGEELSVGEVAGRPVTTLDYGSTLQYIFSSADTIWVISDPLGERAKVEEAIESLP